MAKLAKAKPKKKVGGPFLAAAVFCESLMEDSDKMVSAIRIMDSVTVWIAPNAPPNVPSKEHPAQLSRNILILFRSGDASGVHDLRLVMQQPNGKRQEVAEQKVKLGREPHGGITVKTHVVMNLYSRGVYWVDVYLDGKRYTRMPLQVNFERLTAKK